MIFINETDPSIITQMIRHNRVMDRYMSINRLAIWVLTITICVLGFLSEFRYRSLQKEPLQQQVIDKQQLILDKIYKTLIVQDQLNGKFTSLIQSQSTALEIHMEVHPDE